MQRAFEIAIGATLGVITALGLSMLIGKLLIMAAKAVVSVSL